MKIKSSIRTTLLCLALGLPAVSAFAEDWHFVVKNTTSTNITGLQVSQDNQQWGAFDIGSGIGPGETAKLVWGANTGDQNCEQWIRAKFADGKFSEAAKENFCKDLDTPIEFSE